MWVGALLFTGMLALPAIFITPGQVVYRLPLLGWPITSQGLGAAAYLITRVETAATFSLLLILCTPWAQVLKALRVLRVPVVFVVILGMTYRYIFLMLQTAQECSDRAKAAWLADCRARISGDWPARAWAYCQQEHPAQRRCVSGDAFARLSADLYARPFQMQMRDWIALAGLLAVAVLAFWLGGSGAVFG